MPLDGNLAETSALADACEPAQQRTSPSGGPSRLSAIATGTGTRRRFCLRGVLDARTVGLAVAIAEHEIGCGSRHVWLDLGAVYSIDEDALVILRELNDDVRAAGCTLVVSGASIEALARTAQPVRFQPARRRHSRPPLRVLPG